MAKRLGRVNEILKEELGNIVLREMEFPTDVLVTLTRVETSTDLSIARVYVSVLPEEKTVQVISLLQRRIYELQGFLNRRMKMRPMPRIRFIKEPKISGAAKIEELLGEAGNEDNLENTI